jgi:hypothetical protein
MCDHSACHPRVNNPETLVWQWGEAVCKASVDEPNPVSERQLMSKCVFFFWGGGRVESWVRRLPLPAGLAAAAVAAVRLGRCLEGYYWVPANQLPPASAPNAQLLQLRLPALIRRGAPGPAPACRCICIWDAASAWITTVPCQVAAHKV